VNAPSSLLAGRYRLLRRLATGGMGELYLALAVGVQGFEKLIVVKRILPHFAANPEFLAMFLNEARLSAKIDHPNVVRVYDQGRAGDSVYFTMEYLHGQHLGRVISTVRMHGQEFPIAHAVAIAAAMCEGLHCAHEMRGVDGQPQEIVHRDVSPSNIFVMFSGQVKLVDFGIAKALSSTNLTREGARKGKANYMSPEQCRAEPVDRRSDIFSLGIVLYEMLTLQRLFAGENEFAVMNQIVRGIIPPPSSRRPIPAELERIVLKALAAAPDDRYPTAQAMAEDLQRFAAAEGLVCSSGALAEFLHGLFGHVPYPALTEDVGPAEQDAALQWYGVPGPDDFVWSGVTFDVNLGSLMYPPPATLTRPGAPAVQARSRRRAWAIGAGVVAAGLLVIGLGWRATAHPQTEVTAVPPPAQAPAPVTEPLPGQAPGQAPASAPAPSVTPPEAAPTPASTPASPPQTGKAGSSRSDRKTKSSTRPPKVPSRGQDGLLPSG
jgi:serine/threonine-protein kinase